MLLHSLLTFIKGGKKFLIHMLLLLERHAFNHKQTKDPFRCGEMAVKMEVDQTVYSSKYVVLPVFSTCFFYIQTERAEVKKK